MPAAAGASSKGSARRSLTRGFPSIRGEPLCESSSIEDGELVPVEVEGVRGKRFVVRDEVDLLAAPGEPPPSVAFLSPFDPLVWDRALLGSLFEFDYVWDIFHPPEKRRFGYYVLPIVFRDRFVGRIEPKIDRSGGPVQVVGLWWEDGFTPRRADGFVDAMRSALRAYLGVRRLGPSRVGAALSTRQAPVPGAALIGQAPDRAASWRAVDVAWAPQMRCDSVSSSSPSSSWPWPITMGPTPTGEAAQGAVASTSADIPACGLRLPPPTAVVSPTSPSRRVAGRLLRALAGGFRLCRLLRADGSRFAQAEIDRLRQVLELRFFRRSGTLLFASDAQFPAKTTSRGGRRRLQQRHIRHHRPAQMAAARTSGGSARRPATSLPTRSSRRSARPIPSGRTTSTGAISPTTRKPSPDYQGRTELKAKHDGKNVVHWGSLEGVQGCSGALACAATWYDEQGNPVESDIRFSTAEKWSVSPDADSYDIQSVAAHEFGHVRQFDHVTGGDNTVVMWPYISRGDTSLRKLGRGDSRGNTRIELYRSG